MEPRRLHEAYPMTNRHLSRYINQVKSFNKITKYWMPDLHFVLEKMQIVNLVQG